MPAPHPAARRPGAVTDVASRLLGFPDPVNEVSARLVAAGVVTMAAGAVVLDWRWLTVPLAYGFVLVPRVVRDRVYDVIAAHRYRWFGRRSVCMVATPDLRRRFLDSSPPPPG